MELTQKQKRALLLSKQGKRNKEIGARLGKGPSSAHYAVTSGKRKLESAVKIVEWAGRNGLLNHRHVERLRKILKS